MFSAMQYTQRKSHRSVTDTRRYVIARINGSIKGAVIKVNYFPSGVSTRAKLTKFVENMGKGDEMRVFVTVAACVGIVGCAEIEQAFGAKPEKQEAAPVVQPVEVETPAIQEIANTGAPIRAEALDVVSVQEKEKATAQVATRTSLGVTIVSLGNPAQTGLWMRSSLVQEPTKGRVVLLSSGEGVIVDLLPLQGDGGEQLSLSALRTLNAPLTSLSEVEVFAL